MDAQGRSRPCRSAVRVTAQILLSFLAFSSLSAAASPDTMDGQVVLPPGTGPVLTPEPPAPAEHVFLHRRRDVDQGASVFLAAEDGFDRDPLPPLHARSRPAPIQRLADRRPSVVDPLVQEARERGYVGVLSPDAWTVDTVAGPDVTDKGTVVSMAYMASNAYVETPDEADWDDVGAPFNRSADFGWEGDGLRGHVFADATNATVVIGLKGTSLAVFDGEGTTTNDKENDNLFFSCCCAQQGQWTYHQVCDCATGTYACNNTCVRQALTDENRYYRAARALYANISADYPDASIWLTGHSLGGAVSSFLGLTYGLPVVTFQAVPDALAAGRLGLPVPPGAHPDYPQTRDLSATYHFGHTADPIYIGTCNGATASCSYAGYALETACHTGYECVYDVVADKGWRVGVGTHKIRSVIREILLPYANVPVCRATPECRDCASWKMYESNGTETTTSASSKSTSSTRTRTQTCKTPGWWGCLDETTTGSHSRTATVTTTTSTTSTTTTTTTTSVSTSTTCKTPGRFWGCLDESTSTSTSTAPATTTRPLTTTISPTTSAPSTSHSSTSHSSTTCATPGRFWGCWDETDGPVTVTAPATSTPTSTGSAAPTGPLAGAPPAETKPGAARHCRVRSWLGVCQDWGDVLEL